MQNYTVTISPDDGLGARTVISVEVDAGAARITELALIAAEGGSVSTAKLPAINLEMLLASMLPTAASTAAVAGPTLSTLAPSPAGDMTARASVDDTRVAAGARSPRTARKLAGNATKPPAGKKAVRKASTKKAVAEPEGGRTYRTMPDDFASTYSQAKTVAAVADYYGVPRHTAQGWVSTARRRGLISPARSRTSR